MGQVQRTLDFDPVCLVVDLDGNGDAASEREPIRHGTSDDSDLNVVDQQSREELVGFPFSV